MSRRHVDALAIQNGGACNPSGIAHAIIEAVREARAEGKDALKDPAVRLMVHQLAFLCKVSELEDELLVFGELMEECRRAQANLGGGQ
jgi:hypothetical protein